MYVSGKEILQIQINNDNHDKHRHILCSILSAHPYMVICPCFEYLLHTVPISTLVYTNIHWVLTPPIIWIIKVWIHFITASGTNSSWHWLAFWAQQQTIFSHLTLIVVYLISFLFSFHIILFHELFMSGAPKCFCIPG